MLDIFTLLTTTVSDGVFQSITIAVTQVIGHVGKNVSWPDDCSRNRSRGSLVVPLEELSFFYFLQDAVQAACRKKFRVPGTIKLKFTKAAKGILGPKFKAR